MHVEVKCALEWMAAHTVHEVREHRERMISWVEKEANRFKTTGACTDWLAQCNADVKKVSANVNGPLWVLLLDVCKHSDAKCPELFRHGPVVYQHLGVIAYFAMSRFCAGAPLFGTLGKAGIGETVVTKGLEPEHALRDKIMEHNRCLFDSLQDDPHEEELMKLTKDDAVMGRMSEPVPGVYMSWCR